MSDLYLAMVQSARGKGDLPDPCPPAIESFSRMTNDRSSGLEYAGLQEVFNYLRRGKYLDIPLNWRQFISKPT